MAQQFYAHSQPARPVAEWEPLAEHLAKVADLAGRFAARFGAPEWGRQLGLWHDLGKYSARFQNYLLQANGFEAHLEEKSEVFTRVDHSTAGAKQAVNAFPQQPVIGWLLAYAIAGHHTGLPDGSSDRDSCLKVRLQKRDLSWEGAPPEVLKPLTLHPPPQLALNDPKRAAFQLALFARMLFSCLVDADFLATEDFYDPDRSAQRQAPLARLDELLALVNKDLQERADKAKPSDVNQCRREILSACRQAAALPPGLFSLTVPTGGGKTLASLAFALEHARLNPAADFERVIYAIPFTSIIEQTASIFRSLLESLGEDVVLEHHSNLDPERQPTVRSRLAAENWDAPLVVTTNVQLFESLFAARPSRCRKLHRLVRSILILDEVQTLPVELLRPCLAVLRELADSYHCTVVLCTATQPAFDHRDDFPIGLENVREIIPDPQALYQRMRRTEVTHLGKQTDLELVDRLRQHDQFLCIVNSRKHAVQLYDVLRAEHAEVNAAGLFHLSTWMCGAHRSLVIDTIKQRLKNGLPCRVVSTSLIEAGVDLDFPVVYRALAGIDAIAQAAGRCNREGERPLSPVFLFEPAEARPSTYVRSTIASTLELLPDHADLLSLAAVRHYFELHFWKHRDRWDANDVMECFKDAGSAGFYAGYEYRKAAERFEFIEERERPLIVPWRDAGRELVQELQTAESAQCWKIARKLQRYTVGVRYDRFERLLGSDVQLVREGDFGDRFPVLENLALYDDERGLQQE